MRVLTNSLGGTELTRAFVAGTAPAEWYPGLAKTMGSQGFLANHARDVAAEFVGRDWLSPLAPAFGSSSSSSARDRLARAARGGIVVTTGQQPGLFGGPMYTLSKALTALAFADELEERTGLAVAPVFWGATDDADYAESSSVVIPVSDSAVEIRVEKRDEVQRPLASEPLPDTGPALDEFLRGVGSSANASIVDLVKRSYAGKSLVGEAYIELLRGILEPMGISVLDAAHPAVRSAGHSVLQSALANADRVADALGKRNAEIKAAGYKVQVKEVKGRSLAFRYSNEGKERISVAHAAAAANEVKPGNLSATVLLRPVMERAILPTAAYVAGPAEVGYFAQVSAVADAIAAKQPIVVPRWSGTVVEPRVERILSRYKLEPKDFADPHALEGKKARDGIPDSLRQLISQMRSATSGIEPGSQSNGETLLPDAVLTGLQRDIGHRLDRFERRAAAAVKRQGTQELRDIHSARESLYPLGRPQERAVSFVALLARYGDELRTQMLDAARTHVSALR